MKVYVLDEIPMMWACLAWIWCVYHLENTHQMRFSGAVICIYGLYMTAIHVRFGVNKWFQMHFGFLIIVGELLSSSGPYFWPSVAYALLGTACWLTDLHHHIQSLPFNPQLLAYILTMGNAS